MANRAMKLPGCAGCDRREHELPAGVSSGFLSHPDLSKESTSGTSGKVMASSIRLWHISWLKGNVDAFGGDANKVTIFGTSAGGSSVLYLMASPLARGLFNSAIAQSSANVFFPLRYRNRAAFAYEPAEIAGLRLGPNIDTLRALSVAELLSRVPPPAIEPAAVEYWPTVDGHVLPEHPADLFERGAAARVPLIVGNTTDEGTLFAALHPVKTVPAWRELVPRWYPQAATDLLEQYPARSDADLFGAISRYVTDWVFAGTYSRSSEGNGKPRRIRLAIRVHPREPADVATPGPANGCDAQFRIRVCVRRAGMVAAAASEPL